MAHVDPAVVAARPMNTNANSSHSHQSQSGSDAMTSHTGYASQAAYTAATSIQDQLAQLSSQVQAQVYMMLVMTRAQVQGPTLNI